MKTLIESGIKWLGHIPASWELGKIGGLYALRTEKVSDKDYPPLSVAMKGILPQLETAAKTNDGDNRKLVRKGDFAINSRSDRRGSCGISEYDGSVSLINLVLTPRRTMCPQYYNWLFHTIQFADEFYSWGHGIVSDLWSTNWQEMKKITIPIPPLDEQRVIADYLDAQCAKIDDLLESLRQQLQQLQSYRESTITEAVTRGLNPNVTLIDSGKEWCPQIPAHWIPTNPKALFTLRNQRAKEGERQLTASQKLGIVYQDEFMESEGQKVVTVEKDFSILKHVEPNDFVISMRSFQGGLEYSELSGSISSAYVMLIPNDAKVYPPFYKWFFKSSKYINAIQSTTNLVRDGQAMRYANFVKVPLFIIPMEEQIEIADYLNEKIAQIDSIIADKQNQVNILMAYRKSLIFEYVTGKKEVPAQ